MRPALLCIVSWNAARRMFVLEDLGSTNGTFLTRGERLASGSPRDLPVGSRFYIGNLQNQFEVIMDSPPKSTGTNPSRFADRFV